MTGNFDHVLRITRKQQRIKSVCLRDAGITADVDTEELLLVGAGRLDLSGETPRLVASPKFSCKSDKRQHRAKQLFRHEMEHLINMGGSRFGVNGLEHWFEIDRDSIVSLASSEDTALADRLHSYLEGTGFKWSSEVAPQENVAKALEIIMIRTYPFLRVFPEAITVSNKIHWNGVRAVLDSGYNTQQKRIAEITPVYSELVQRFGNEFMQAVLPGCAAIYKAVHHRYMGEEFLPTHGIGFDKFAARTGLESDVIEQIRQASLDYANTRNLK